MLCCWHIQSSSQISLTRELQVQGSDFRGPFGQVKRHRKTNATLNAVFNGKKRTFKQKQ